MASRGTLPGIGRVDQPTRLAFLSLQRDLELASPLGMGSPWFTNTAPEGWQLLDGSAISRTTYPRLFALWGTTYGVGDGSTTFNVPNLKGRVPVGRDSTQVEFDVLGETGGAKTHTLVTGELPSHQHTIDHDHPNVTSTTQSVDHTHSGSTSTPSQSHYHDFGGVSVLTGGTTWYFNQASGSFGAGAISNTNWASHDHTHSFTTGGMSTNHTHDVNLPNFTGSSGFAGSGTGHNNLQPYLVMNWIVRLG